MFIHIILQSFQLLEKKGDLFRCPATESLVHCVSKDLHMGKGIATLFKKHFQGVEELKSQGIKTFFLYIIKIFCHTTYLYRNRQCIWYASIVRG